SSSASAAVAAANAATNAAYAYSASDAAAYAAYASADANAAGQSDAIDVNDLILADFRAISHLSAANHWTNETPVPPWLFGPMWPNGVPKGWPEADPEERLVVTVATPAEMPVEEVVGFQNELHDLLSQLAIAHGGTGLTLDRTGRDVPVVVPAGTGV
ncbi:MAG TPA: hypothetical protein VH092_21325, partial [Urbifossiella sp.]|nr:hypothetical protein [Urbifossiella sp.]